MEERPRVKVQTLAGQLLFSTVRIEASRLGKGSVGTGFIFAYEFDTEEEDKWAFFMVTNKHTSLKTPKKDRSSSSKTTETRIRCWPGHQGPNHRI